MESDHALHRNTPKLAVVDPRGLAIAAVAYYRRTSAQVSPEPRVTRETFDAAGRSLAHWDPRLGSGDTPIASLTTVVGLSGNPLLTDSVDAGWRLVLPDQAGLIRQNWDEAGNTTRFAYDSMGRPLSIEQTSAEGVARCVERLYYGTCEPATSARNQCGRLMRHADTAGVRGVSDYGLQGTPLTEWRRFLGVLDHPGWPDTQHQQDALLEQGADNVWSTSWQYDAAGTLLEQADAAGHRRRHAYTIQGRLQAIWLTVKGKAEQLVVGDICYNALGEVECETAGNGVISSSHYDPANGRLRQLLTVRGDQSLQDLSFDHDPVGNIVGITDQSQPDSWFANQRIAAANCYGYDTLYQLICATGREVASACNGPALPDLISPIDPSRLQSYTQSWFYDAGGNLLEQRHSGKPSHFMDIDKGSNRGLPRKDGPVPDFDVNFDRNGNLKCLTSGQPLRWTVRNQLDETVLVTRGDGCNDSERYIYDAAGMRVRKVRMARTANVVCTSEVRYLPGLEIRTDGVNDTAEALQVINVSAGRNTVRFLHWEYRYPDGIEEDQIRYSSDDHLGSGTLELDELGNLISYEGYYAYGATALWMGRSQVEAKYKFVRYSGKERDASGFYYYGYRYYAPWLQRWISPDPAGIADGLNSFCMVGGNPVCHRDVLGLYAGRGEERELAAAGKIIDGRGREDFSERYLKQIDKALMFARKITGETLEVLSEKNDFDKGLIIESVFQGSLSRDDLVNRTKVIHDALPLYRKKGSRGDQLALIRSSDPDSKTLALTIPGDRHKRIFLTREAIGRGSVTDTVALALILIHEITHLELRTADFHYYSRPSTDVSIEEYWAHLDEDVAELNAGSSLDKNMLAEISRHKANDLTRVFGTSSIERIQSNFSYYKPKALRVNADSITVGLALYALPGLEKRLSKSAGGLPTRAHRYEPAPDYQ